MNDNNMYKKLPPFKWFVLQNFPFIEEDFDAITNYQLMCKIVEYLNRNIDKTNELGEQVEALTNWFNNLDVQDEIDNKLDEMAQDGTLAKIINEQIFTELNNQVQTNTGAISDLQTAITNIENKINPIDFYKGKNLVVFGDSFTDPENQNSINGQWVKRVCQATGMNAFNFAKGAASFMRPYNSFRMQVNNALQMTDEEKQNTSIIIFYAPDTDVIENINLTDYYTEVDSLVELCVQNFPNAKIIFAGFTWRVNYLTDDYNNKMNSMLFNLSRNLSKYPVVFLKNCRFWLLGLTGYYQNQYHPNEGGYNVIAQYFVNAIYGGTNDSYRNTDIIPLNIPNITDDNYCEFEVVNGQVSIKMFVTFDKNISNYDARFRLPTFAVPHHDIMIPFIDINSNIVGSLRLTSANDGEGIVKFPSLNQGVNAFLVPNSFRACACRDF